MGVGIKTREHSVTPLQFSVPPPGITCTHVFIYSFKIVSPFGFTHARAITMRSWSFLAPLLLLLSVPRALSGGEYCHGWRDAAGARHRGFRCPERYDGEGARYCCGSCSLRYCCAAPDARLDQSTCPAEFDFYTEGARDVPPTRKNFFIREFVFIYLFNFIYYYKFLIYCLK